MTTSGHDHPRRPRNGRGRYVRSLDNAERDAAACRLRAEGLTFDEVATRLGYADRSAARRAIEAALAATVAEPAAILRQLELQRLDALHRTAWALLDAEDADVRLKAIDRALRVMERRARLLGLDAPTRVETVTIDAVEAEIARLSAQLGLGTEVDG